MKCQESVKKNVEILDDTLTMLYAVQTKLNELVNIDGVILYRTNDLRSYVKEMISDAEGLRHDLRDDYDNGYKIVGNKD